MVTSRTLLLLAAALSCATIAASHSHSYPHSPGLDEDHHGADPHSTAEFAPIPLVQFPSNDIPDPWTSKYGGVARTAFAGVTTYAHLPTSRCLDNPDELFDVAVLGIPYDLTVTYRPGARFGPNAIRQASRRQRSGRTFSMHHGMDPYNSGLRFLDCDDIPTSPMDPALAIDQIEAGYSSLLQRVAHSDPSSRDPSSPPASVVAPETWEAFSSAGLAKDGRSHPKIVSMGGDHTIVLPILRSLYRVYGPIAVIHFDAHLDTWPPEVSPVNSPTRQHQIQHGTFFWQAALEGLIARNQSIHAGIRTRLGSYDDIEHDASIGFDIITSDDIDDIGIPAIIANIRARVGTMPVYLSIDIDTLDPGFAPGTGTMESAGWSPRELRRILRGLEGLNFVGFDLVEVSPAYDQAEITAYAASDLIYEFMNLLIKGNGMQSKGKVAEPKAKGRGKKKSVVGSLFGHGDEL
ncbi:Ureohydrolase [Kalmanozyma brasiliensis GHG001]|uniref:Arginase n=1 Tax=Kalmanozyma brasiliensis (strain GHG001) TaxID=1365824 RepID=V5GPA7_KALBG|nr:Ureohydrolase [Kalmanozyma brasiliensis GHG001]EST07802.1 Ureohydrolase [Kalmanozyma brasiliensis GHG001]